MTAIRGTVINMDPIVKGYLVDHTLAQLEDEHGVCARFSADWTKASLNYDQVLVKNGDVLAEQCRGMVIRVDFSLTERLRAAADQVNAWKTMIVGCVDVVAWPMDRFYNFGDHAAADVDWSDPGLRVYEKLDGTMIVVYWDEMQLRWHAATRSVPEADLPIRQGDMQLGDLTFSGLFFRALKETREALSGDSIDWDPSGFGEIVHLNKELTYVFELTSPFNRIVVQYDSPRVTLLAARHTASGRELTIESMRLEHVQRPKVWPLRDAAALDAFVNSADPAALEGAVVCDSGFRRLKVKNRAWVLSSRAKDLVTVSRRSALEAIIQGSIDDVIPLVDKAIADELLQMRSALQDYLRQIDANFKRWRDEAAGSRKEFAARVVSSGDWTPAYFNLWEGRARSATEWVTATSTAGKLSSGTLDLILTRLGMATRGKTGDGSGANVGAVG